MKNFLISRNEHFLVSTRSKNDAKFQLATLLERFRCRNEKINDCCKIELQFKQKWKNKKCSKRWKSCRNAIWAAHCVCKSRESVRAVATQRKQSVSQSAKWYERGTLCARSPWQQKPLHSHFRWVLSSSLRQHNVSSLKITSWKIERYWDSKAKFWLKL